MQSRPLGNIDRGDGLVIDEGGDLRGGRFGEREDGKGKEERCQADTPRRESAVGGGRNDRCRTGKGHDRNIKLSWLARPAGGSLRELQP
jgi:hypothetical protein